MKNFKLPKGVYAITDSETSLGKNLIEYSTELLLGGAKILQYREKNKRKGEILKEALELKKLTTKFNALFIINDYIDIALLVDADGVHLGQKDLPLKEARKLLGENKIIGISANTFEEAKEAELNGADYIGVGPIFSTQTKKDANLPTGTKLLTKIKENLSIPFTAIGGIKLSNLDEVLKTGTTSICLVSELLSAPNTFEITKKINDKIIKNSSSQN